MKNNIESLFKSIAEKESGEDLNETVDFVNEALNSFTHYFNVVYKDYLQGQLNRNLYEMGKIDREELVYRIEKNDAMRRTAHDVAIGKCNQLNRLCDRYGVERFCPGEEADRTEIAEFIGKFVYNFYQEGLGKNDKLIENEPKSLDEAIEHAKKKFVSPDTGYNTNANFAKSKEGDDLCR